MPKTAVNGHTFLLFKVVDSWAKFVLLKQIKMQAILDTLFCLLSIIGGDDYDN